MRTVSRTVEKKRKEMSAEKKCRLKICTVREPEEPVITGEDQLFSALRDKLHV